MKLFEDNGAHVLVDGQFGSTGKGALAAWLATMAVATGNYRAFAGSISTSGPNSGHTSYLYDKKIVLKQLPTFGVHLHLRGFTIPIYLAAGSIIDPDVLVEEALRYPDLRIFVHPNAAVVAPKDKVTEQSGSIKAIASTQSGTGAALASKIMREPSAIARNSLGTMPSNVVFQEHNLRPDKEAYFIEVGQGFSLGINSEFYPHVTSRECTVMQALADTRITPGLLAKTYMCVRTYPIRVGNLEGYSSGDWYDDQEETTWEAIGQTPELTTVTKRIRRIATFSEQQFLDAIRANDPDWVAVNFLNYLDADQLQVFMEALTDHQSVAQKRYGIILGRGPTIDDWMLL